MKRLLPISLAVIVSTGCTATIKAVRFKPDSTVHAKAPLPLVVTRVTYSPADRHELRPNQIAVKANNEFEFEQPIATYVKQCVERELDASGFNIDQPGGRTMSIDVTRLNIMGAVGWPGMGLELDSTWALTSGAREVTKTIHVERRGGKLALLFNAMITEAYERFLTDPEVRPLLSE